MEYFDKNGIKIQAGDVLRRDNGEEDSVVKVKSDLGFTSSKEYVDRFGNSQFYSLSLLDLSEYSVVAGKDFVKRASSMKYPEVEVFRPAEYEVYFEKYTGYVEPKCHSLIKFKARNDWHAVLALLLKEAPTKSAIEEYCEDCEVDFEVFCENYSTLRDLVEHYREVLDEVYDDKVFYLRNLTTGQIIYSCTEELEVRVDSEADEDVANSFKDFR